MAEISEGHLWGAIQPELEVLSSELIKLKLALTPNTVLSDYTLPFTLVSSTRGQLVYLVYISYELHFKECKTNND